MTSERNVAYIAWLGNLLSSYSTPDPVPHCSSYQKSTMNYRNEKSGLEQRRGAKTLSLKKTRPVSPNSDTDRMLKIQT